VFYAGAKAVPLAVKKRLARIATTTAQFLDSDMSLLVSPYSQQIRRVDDVS
jgi:hypothetical protein